MDEQSKWEDREVFDKMKEHWQKEQDLNLDKQNKAL